MRVHLQPLHFVLKKLTKIQATDLRISRRLRLCVGAWANMESTFGPPNNVGSDGNNSSYEEAMVALNNLQSNAESIARSRQNSNQKMSNVSNMAKYIQYSGLTMSDVDRLSVIHVSGTKGKGSTCAFCERILSTQGYRTGLFTSPHLVEVRERIRVNGKPISKQLFSKFFWKVYNSLQTALTKMETETQEVLRMPPYFAFLTVMSLHVFLSEGVDVAIYEVGIGGEYDSTNFFQKPVVCGVTSLGLDHTSLLGNTIAEIAWNKAGILKRGRPAITVPHEQAALEVLHSRALKIEAPLYIVNDMSEELIKKFDIQLGIAGNKQRENASLAIQLCRFWIQEHTGDIKTLLSQYVPAAADRLEDIPRLEITELEEATVTALKTCKWPGRAQTLHRDDVTYYLDGAHTKESMEVCVQWFQEESKKELNNLGGKNCARLLLFNATSDRDVGALLSQLTLCNFDAALFCTNLLSNQESFNRADQVNKGVSSKCMLDRVESNRLLWNELNAQYRETTSDCDLHRDSNLITDLNSKLPHQMKNINTPKLNIEDEILLEKNHNQPEQDRSKHVFGAARKLSTSLFNNLNLDSVLTDGHLNSQCHEPNMSTDDHLNDQYHDFNMLTDGHLNGQCHEPNMLTYGHNNCQRHSSVLNSHIHNSLTCFKNSETERDARLASQPCTKNIDKLLPRKTLNRSIQHHSQPYGHSVIDDIIKVTPVAETFPTILQALSWATQGRAAQIEARGVDLAKSDFPAHLRQADHVQILVTGSLHLVGGVLGLVDPQMND